jgi:hypothetical protein
MFFEHKDTKYIHPPCPIVYLYPDINRTYQHVNSHTHPSLNTASTWECPERQRYRLMGGGGVTRGKATTSQTRGATRVR